MRTVVNAIATMIVIERWASDASRRRSGRDGTRRAAGVWRSRRRRHARSAVLWPNRPEGLKIRTKVRTMNTMNWTSASSPARRRSSR